MLTKPEKLTKQECIDLCKEVIKWLSDNPLMYAWRGKFLIERHFISGDYLAVRAGRDPEIREYYKLIAAKASENIDNAVRAGTIQYGYGTYLLKCFRNADWQTPKEELEVKKLKAEVENIKSSTQLNNEILIGFDDECKD
jgi:hypothetical protein